MSSKPPLAASRWMIFAFWIGLVAFLTWLFQQQLDRRYNPNQSLTVHSDAQNEPLVLKRNSSGHYLVNGRVNNRPVTFLVDTGATDVVVPGSMQAELGLRRGTVIFSQTANGSAVGWQTRIQSLRLGGMQMSDVRATILPSYSGRELLLGMSFLKRLELIQRGNTLTLRYPD